MQLTPFGLAAYPATENPDDILVACEDETGARFNHMINDAELAAALVAAPAESPEWQSAVEAIVIKAAELLGVDLPVEDSDDA